MKQRKKGRKSEGRGVSLPQEMRLKVTQAKRHRARGVSLPPEMETSALKKAAKLDISFSKYVQRLIRADLENNRQHAQAA
jgi:hypothetical protein